MCNANALLQTLTQEFAICEKPKDFVDSLYMDYDSEILQTHLSRLEYNQLNVGELKSYRCEISALSPEGFCFFFQDFLRYAHAWACKKKRADWYVDLIIMTIESDLQSEDSVIKNRFTQAQFRAAAGVIASIVECEKEIKSKSIFSFVPTLNEFWSKYLDMSENGQT
jgi:hypothetical protein